MSFWKQFRMPAEKAQDQLVLDHDGHLFYLDDCPKCQAEKTEYEVQAGLRKAG